MNEKPDRMLAVSQVAKRLNLSESYVYELLNEGKITHYPHGKRAKRVKSSDLDAYMRRICVKAQLDEAIKYK